MSDKKLGFIGLGNMAEAMIGGMLKRGITAPENIIGSSRTEETASKIREKYDITVILENRKVAEMSDILFLAARMATRAPPANQIVVSPMVSTSTTMATINNTSQKINISLIHITPFSCLRLLYPKFVSQAICFYSTTCKTERQTKKGGPLHRGAALFSVLF